MGKSEIRNPRRSGAAPTLKNDLSVEVQQKRKSEKLYE
jgi:hypothetical protein